MQKEKHIPIILIICSICIICCENPHRKTIKHHSDNIEIVLNTYKDSLFDKPDVVIDTCLKLQQTVTDSLRFYQLASLLVKGYYFNGQPDSALKINQQVIHYFQSLPSPSCEAIKLAADAYNSRGIFLNAMDKRDTAISSFSMAYSLLNNAPYYKEELPSICINLADCYLHEGNHTLCSFYYRRGLAISDSLHIGAENNYSIFSGMAKLYQELGNYDLAEEYYQKAQQWLDHSSLYDRYFFQNAYGSYFYITKDYDRSLECFREASRIAGNFPQTYYQGISQGNMGEIFILKEEPDSAQYYLDHAKDLLGEFYYQPSLKFYMDGLYASLALLKNQLPEAEKLLTQPYDAAQINPQYQYHHYQRLQELYRKKQDFRKAYQYYMKAIAYDDSLRNLKIQGNIAEIDSRYRQDTILIRKDMKIALTEQQASQWQKIALSSIISFILLLILIIGVIHYRRKLRELKHQKQVGIITGLRMEIIRNRLSPHFVFNALNTVMPSLEHYKELKEPFQLLIRLLRNNLRASEQTAVPLEEEISLVKDYLHLHTMRNDSKIVVDWQIDENTPLQALIPSMAIQIPIENAVKYAFSGSSLSPSIRVGICLQEQRMLHIIIEDNGQGYQPHKYKNDVRGTGSGLKMLYRTIEILNAKNEEKIMFNIENRSSLNPKEEGTRVTLIIPLHYTFEL
ncbi:histidine kinase [Bacteroides sp. 224]|uniref:histidine kinase n=1 Tax=Bacteroides sp. 224 TaxID=2302936 RepID=UPI0013D7B427|nr:histidine kinase [Bacteroides sp. 224]NDV64164.1 hypothetical protein [Bacteroides sp. 224]